MDGNQNGMTEVKKNQEEKTMRTIFWAGDSTVQTNKIATYPQSGIGQGFLRYINDDVQIKNYARNGRSTKSFLDEGRFLPIEEQMQAGDFLFIQFGHNDEKDDVARHTDPFGSYQDNMCFMIRTAKRKGAYPVLITPLSRRLFDADGKLCETHAPYQQAMKELAEKEQVPCIDLCAISHQEIESMGDEASKQFFMNFPGGIYRRYPVGREDNTHQRYEGALHWAGVIARELRKMPEPYCSLVVTEEICLTVAKDGNAMFGTIAEALEAAEAFRGDDIPVRVQIGEGVYEERLEIHQGSMILEGMGADPAKTVITHGDYAKELLPDGEKRGTFRTQTLFIDADCVTLKNLTVENSAGHGSDVGQALALYADGDRLCFENCRFLGHQDTIFNAPLPPAVLQTNGFRGPKENAPRRDGRHYFKDCFVSGEVDFIFGGATVLFENCELFSINAGKEINGYVTAASTPEGKEFGYVFKDCRLTSECPAESVYLGRPWRNFAKTVLIRCEIGPHIVREGWHDWNKEEARETTYYGEYQCSGEGAADRAKRASWAHELTEEEAANYTRERILGF